MYNTTFQVKYHDIELALLANLQKMMEKKLAIASGMYMEELHEQEKEKERKQKIAATEKEPLTVPTCLNCATCTCSKKGKDKKVKVPKVKKETKKEQKAREEAYFMMLDINFKG